jgi:hypothetical protein
MPRTPAKVTIKIDLLTAFIVGIAMAILMGACCCALASALGWGVTFRASITDGDVHRIVGCIRDPACH